MKLINRTELRTMLLAIESATIISIVSMVEPDMRAKDDEGNRNPFMAGMKLADGFTVVRINKANGRVDTDYNREVENQLRKEIIEERIAANVAPLSVDEMKAEIANRFRKGTSWHRPIMGANGFPTPLSVNKKDGERDDGAAYLRIIVGMEGDSEHLSLDGTPVEADALKPFAPKSKPYSNQGTKDPRQIRTYALANILEIAIGGERYRIIDNFGERPETLRNKAWNIAEEYISGERTMSKV